MQKLFNIQVSDGFFIMKKLSQIKGDQLGIRFYFVDDCFGHALQFGRYFKRVIQSESDEPRRINAALNL